MEKMEKLKEQIEYHRTSARRASNRAAIAMGIPSDFVNDAAYIGACAQLGESLVRLAQYHADELARVRHRIEQEEIFNKRVDREVYQRLAQLSADHPADFTLDDAFELAKVKMSYMEEEDG